MTFIICPSNNVFQMYLRSLKISKEERINYQRLTDPDKLIGLTNISVIIIGNDSHQYFSFTNTIRILEVIKIRKNTGNIKEIKKLVNF